MVVTHVLGISELWSLCNVGVCDHRVFQNWLEVLWLIWSLDVHLTMIVCECRLDQFEFMVHVLLIDVCL